MNDNYLLLLLSVVPTVSKAPITYSYNQTVWGGGGGRYVYAYMCVCVVVVASCMFVICAYVCVCSSSTSSFMYVCDMCICSCVRVCVCVHACMYVFSSCIYIYIGDCAKVFKTAYGIHKCVKKRKRKKCIYGTIFFASMPSVQSSDQTLPKTPCIPSK